MTKTDPPPSRNYGQETRDTLQAQIDLSPALLRAEQQARPGYTALELETLRTATLGGGGQQGLVDLYAQIAPRLSAMDTEANRAQRQSDIVDIMSMGPQAQAALRASNPAQWALLDTLTQQAQGDLAAGSGLTPHMRRELEQQVRASQTSRGMGLGPIDAFEEAMTTGMAGQQLQDARRRFAMGVVGLNQSLVGDPFLQILGRSSGVAAGAMGATQQGQGLAGNLGPQLFNPESQYAADLSQGNYEGMLAARTSTANNRAGLFGGLIQGFGALAGGALGRRN